MPECILYVFPALKIKEIGPFIFNTSPSPSLDWRDKSKEEKGEVPIRSPHTNCWGKQSMYTKGVVFLRKSPVWGFIAPPQVHCFRDHCHCSKTYTNNNCNIDYMHCWYLTFYDIEQLNTNNNHTAITRQIYTICFPMVIAKGN